MYYHVYCPTQNTCTPTQTALDDAMQTWCCDGCSNARPTWQEVDVAIEQPHPRVGPLNFVSGCCVGIVRRDFMTQLGPDIFQRDLYLGRLLGPSGDAVENWVTFRGRRRLIIRGDRHVSHRRCPICKRDIYFALGKPYLYPAPPSDAEVFESNLWGLVVADSVLDRLDTTKHRTLRVEPIPIADTPRDGLAILSL